MSDRFARDRGFSRREVLQLLAYGTVGGALVGCTTGSDQGSGPSGSSSTSPSSAARHGWNQRRPERDGPLLVVIEMAGGNDGLSMLAPFESGRYHDLRPTVALGGDQVVDLGDGWGLNGALADLRTWPMAFVAGVGASAPDLSHFAMLSRWWAGTEGGPHGANPPAGTGFLGRICDAARRDEHISGVSLSFGSPAIIRGEEAVTVGLQSLDDLSVDADGDVHQQLLRTYARLAQGSDPALRAARSGIEQMSWVFDMVGSLPEPSQGFPTSVLGQKMAAASRLARSSHGLRVIHIPIEGSRFDTHQEHAKQYQPLMEDVNASLAAFLRDMDRAGLSDHVLVATTSEFGRRAEEHDGGLDHGAASTLLLLGPVVAGIHGEPSSLDRLDGDGNLVATVSTERYLATLAAWMQVDPHRVVARSVEPLDGVLAT